MDLKDFVSSTLVQIVSGVVDSAQQVAALGGAINPVFNGAGAAKHIGNSNQGPIFGVDFDVALVVGAATSGEAGAGIKVASLFNVGATASGQSNEESTSRIRFTVPLALPIDPASKAAAEAKKASQALSVANSAARGMST